MLQILVRWRRYRWNVTNDPTIVQTEPRAMIEVTKVATVTDTNNNNKNDASDIIVYTITVANTGSVTLSGITLNDTN